MTWRSHAPAILIAWMIGIIPVLHVSGDEPDSCLGLESLDRFAASAQEWLPERLLGEPKLWRQVAPSVWWLLRPHADALESQPRQHQHAMAAAAADFVLRKRSDVAAIRVIAADRPIVALLDPDRGLDRRQITTLATAYGTSADVYKLDSADTSLQDVGEAWLRGVGALIRTGRSPTVVVVGHGLPTEIQSYHIPVARLAATLFEASRDAQQAGRQPGQPILIFDDCFSADFCLNLANCLDGQARSDDADRQPLPVMIAGANRDQYGHVDVGEKFVTHFWDVVIELYFVRTPRPTSITLGDFFGPVDNFMYGFGRAPIVEGGKVTGYRVVDATLIQDPVCFVPLDTTDLTTLRRVLGLGETAPVLPLLDAG